jgi:spore coat polysaccharide biosynthesis protein SpsF (cytidylyltransferase family)
MDAIVNVRLSSTRLPGKVLMPLGEGTVLDTIYQRIKLSKNIKKIIINTSNNKNDDKIVEHCKKNNYLYNRGNEEDTLSRTLDACENYSIDSFVEIFGDCPLIDFRVINRAIDIFKNKNFDFVGNDLKTTYPPGFEVEVVKTKALKNSNNICKDISIREHGTLFIRLNKEKYKVYNFEYDKIINKMPHLTLDTKEDYDLINKVYNLCVKKFGFSFSLEDIISILNSDKKLFFINDKVPRKWEKYRE